MGHTSTIEPGALSMKQNLFTTLMSLLMTTLLTGCDDAAATSSGTTEAAQNTAAHNETDEQAGAIYNYIEYSPTFASSGQPSAAQLRAQQANGVERVIYVAFSDHEHSLPNEDRIAKSLGLNYVQIPVDWEAPKPGEYYQFASAMAVEPERKTLLHCQANFRASAFAMLYRVLELGVPLAEAKADMNSVWVPNSAWTRFILDVLKEQNVDSQCAGCDWTPSTIGE